MPGRGTASLIYAGERDGLGYRDTVQDMLGVMHNIPGEAIKETWTDDHRTSFNRGAMPVVKRLHIIQEKKRTRKEDYRSDDCMWLFNSILHT